MLPPSWPSHPKDARKWHPAVHNWVLQWSVPSTVLRVTGPSPWSCESESHSVMSDSLQPPGLYSPWNSPGQNTGVGSLSLLQGIFPTQGSNPVLPHCSRILYETQGKPKNTGIGSLSFLQWIFQTQESNWVSCIAGGFFTNWAIRVYKKMIIF